MNDKTIQSTPRQEELFELREFYAGEDWKEQDLLFLSQALMYACFPYRSVKERTFTRIIKTAKGTIKITLSTVDPSIPLPFGKDRVLLGCALTRARQKGRPAVSFEELDKLLVKFGEDYRNYGGKDYDEFAARWLRLKNCAVSIERKGSNCTEGENKFLIAKYRIPKRKKGPKRSTRMTIAPDEPTGAIQFGTDFWNDYLAYCVPMPVPLMQLFANQPKAWDIATLIHWASYSAIHSKHQGGTGTKSISSRDLLHILGSVDSNERRLRAAIRDVIAEMHTVWPELNVKFEHNGDLLIGAPENEKLLVQPTQYVAEIRKIIQDSFESGPYQLATGR